MENIVLLTHGEFSRGIAQSCRFILGEVQNLEALSITLDESIAQTKKMLYDAIDSFGNGAPTILLTDLPGGSTTQAAIQVMTERSDIYLLSGLNLGLLVSLVMLELTDEREENLKRIRSVVQEAKDTITLINDMQAEAADLSDDGEL